MLQFKDCTLILNEIIFLSLIYFSLKVSLFFIIYLCYLDLQFHTRIAALFESYDSFVFVRINHTLGNLTHSQF